MATSNKETLKVSVKAKIERINDELGYVGSIPLFKGTVVNEMTLKKTIRELKISVMVKLSYDLKLDVDQIEVVIDY